VPPSVPVHHSTRSLPFIRRGYFYFFRLLFVLLKKAGLSSDEKKQTATCVLAVALPPAINLNRYARKGLICLFFFGCRFTLLSLRPEKRGSRSRVAVRDRNTATRFSKKKLSTSWNK
jgi:hypothetical protein